MAEAWRIARSSRTCAHSGRAIAAGEPFYSVLIEKDGTYDRLDYSVESWPEVNPDEFFSYWKNKGGTPEPGKKAPVDYDRLLSFFDGLEDASEEPKRLLRYVLALVLARRRRLRLDDMSRDDKGDKLVAYDRRSGRTLEIRSPDAGREELEAAQKKLNELFDADFDGGDL